MIQEWCDSVRLLLMSYTKTDRAQCIQELTAMGYTQAQVESAIDTISMGKFTLTIPDAPQKDN